MKTKHKLKYGELCICECPDWCPEGFYIAKWNGEAFEGNEDDRLDEHVESYLPLDDDGLPLFDEYIPYER